MKIDVLEDLYLQKILKLLDVEKQQMMLLPKFEVAASSDELGKILQVHFDETKSQMTRLEEIVSELMDENPAGKSKPMRAISAEALEMLKVEMDPEIRDAALIAAAQAAEHFEIASYSSASGFAKLLRRAEESRRLTRSLEEEQKMDQQLFVLSQTLGVEAAAGEETLENP